MKQATHTPIYAIRRDDPEAADHIVADMLDFARSLGILVTGVVQKNIRRTDRVHNDMHLVSIDSCNEYRISEDRGRLSTGCRLDRDLIGRAALEVERSLMTGTPQLFVLNKFGKAEEEGGGMRQAIALAVEREIPVLLSVGRLSMGALLDFAGTLVEIAPADIVKARAWLLSYLPEAASVPELKQIREVACESAR